MTQTSPRAKKLVHRLPSKAAGLRPPLPLRSSGSDPRFRAGRISWIGRVVGRSPRRPARPSQRPDEASEEQSRTPPSCCCTKTILSCFSEVADWDRGLRSSSGRRRNSRPCHHRKQNAQSVRLPRLYVSQDRILLRPSRQGRPSCAAQLFEDDHRYIDDDHATVET